MDRPGVTRDPDFLPSLPLFFRELSPGPRAHPANARNFFSLVVSLATCLPRLCPQRAMTR
jgi:hypothetical protein